jgi:predicted AAA+ superfamily ATPase
MDSNLFSKTALESARALSLVAGIPHRRDLYARISNPTDYFVGLRGLRGVGKTTLMLQLAQNYKNPFYFSADAIYLRSESVYDVASYAVKNGHDAIFIDEIHYQKDWTYSLKTLYDEGIRNVFFTGSSALELRKGADLSRRAVLFELPPATFREYLSIKKGIDLQALSLEEMLSRKKEILPKYSNAFSYFDEYLQYGGFLYDRQEFDLKLTNALVKLASIDLAYLRDININVENDIFRIWHLVSTTASFETNYSKLASALGISKNTVIQLISDLEKAGGLKVCLPCRRGYALIRNEPKLFLPIPMTAFFTRQVGTTPNIGRLREEFFISHVGKASYLKTSRGEKTADFMVGNNVFEIGGVSKTTEQKPDYIVVDGLESSDKKIPLFLFGFMHYV